MDYTKSELELFIGLNKTRSNFIVVATCQSGLELHELGESFSVWSLHELNSDDVIIFVNANDIVITKYDWDDGAYMMVKEGSSSVEIINNLLDSKG